MPVVRYVRAEFFVGDGETCVECAGDYGGLEADCALVGREGGNEGMEGWDGEESCFGMVEEEVAEETEMEGFGLGGVGVVELGLVTDMEECGLEFGGVG